nr:hypothetical protein [Gordonia sp. LAM0048]
MSEQRWLVDTEPSARLPIYTRLNASDVLSDPITPLGADLGWIQNILPGWNAGYAFHGSYSLVEKPDVAASSGIFYGHLYINLSMSRLVGIRGGLSVELVDQLFYGGDPDIPAYVGHPDDENADASARLAARNAWILSTETFPELDEDRVLADRLRTERPDLSSLTPVALVARARSVMPLERAAWRGEVAATNGAAVGPSVLGQLLGADNQDLIVTLVGSAGDVDSALPSFALWELGRMVRADERLTEAFDQGIDGVAARVRGLDPKFDASFADFIAEFGYRGPNEWDLGSTSWETKPELVLGLIDRLRLQEDSASPTARLAEHAGGHRLGPGTGACDRRRRRGGAGDPRRGARLGTTLRGLARTCEDELHQGVARGACAAGRARATAARAGASRRCRSRLHGRRRRAGPPGRRTGRTDRDPCRTASGVEGPVRSGPADLPRHP